MDNNAFLQPCSSYTSNCPVLLSRDGAIVHITVGVDKRIDIVRDILDKSDRPIL